METVRDILTVHDNHYLKVVLFDMFGAEFNERVKLSPYRGRYWDNAQNWACKNIEFIFTSQNAKYTGFHLIMWNAEQKQVFIENKYLDIVPVDYKHALNIVRKYMRNNNNLKNKIEL